jgi:hypothetical protein
MKKSKLIAVTTFLIVSLWMSVSIVNSADYFPLSVGNMWIYYPSFGTKGNRVDTVIGQETINGIQTYIWNRQEAPDDNYNEKRWLAKDSVGVEMYRIWSNQGPDPAVTLNPARTIINLNPTVGNTWSNEGDFGTTHYKETRYIEAINDTISVPSGSFSNCIRIRVLEEITSNSITSFQYYKHWYAPNVGLVIFAKYNANWVSATTTQQLIGFSVTRGLPGDVNSDGKLGLDDAIYILQMISGLRNLGDCSSLVGNWSGTSAGTNACGEPENGTWTTTVNANCSATFSYLPSGCSNCSGGSATCYISGNNFSCTANGTTCGGVSYCTIPISGIFSGNNFSGTVQGCGLTTFTLTGTKQ